jgi:hypothetical protein
MSGITPTDIQSRISSGVEAMDAGDYISALRFLEAARALMAGIPRFELERGGEVEWRPEQLDATIVQVRRMANQQQMRANGGSDFVSQPVERIHTRDWQ